MLGNAFLIASRSIAGAADAVPTNPVMLATNRVDAARVFNEVDIIVPFLCVSHMRHHNSNPFRPKWERHAEIPSKQRNEWGGFLREESEKVRRLTAKIKQAEHEVDAIIDKLVDLTLARSRFSNVRLPGNIDCHVNGWRLSFPQNSGTLSMGARPSKPPREDARLNPRTRSGAGHDALFTEVQRRRRKQTSKLKPYRAFSLGPNPVFVSPRAANMYVCAECQTLLFDCRYSGQSAVQT